MLRHRLAAILVLLLAAIASACNDSQAEPRSIPRAPQFVPVKGGTFRMVLEAPNVIDPAAVDSVYDALPVGQLFDGLVALDPGLNVVPALADTWTISRDGRVYTFHLRNNVRFHDGLPLTADDVVYSIRRLLDPARDKKSIAVSYLQVIDGALAFTSGKSKHVPGLAAVDPHTVRITLARPYLSFLEVLAMDDLRVVPEHLLVASGEAAFRKMPIGTGPFRFSSRDGESLRMTANADYFGGAPYLDEIVIMFPRPNERDGGNARFLAGDTQIVEPSSDALPTLLKDPGVELHRYQELSVSFLGMNTGSPPLDDERVRRAVAMAIDRTALAGVAPSRRREAQGILPPGLPGYSPNPKALAYDPEGARKALAEAGYPGGRGLRPITFYSAQSTASATRQTNELLKRNLAAVGIVLNVRETSWSELIAYIEDNNAPTFQLGWVADLPDPDSFLRTLFEPGGAGNYFSFLDTESAGALERGAAEMNPIERAKIYRQLEQTVLAKAPLVPLFHSIGMIASRRNVHGFKPGPFGIASLDLEHVWLTPQGGPG